jgi:lysozyme
MKRALASLLSLAACGCGAAPVAGSLGEAVTLCPAGATVAGIDTSSWQGAIDWRAVAQAGRAFAIARVSDGLDYPDAQFAHDWPAIAAAGLVRGAYQFFRPSQDPIAQAELFLAALARSGGLGAADLPPIIDLETSDGETNEVVVARAHAWLDAIELRTGKRPMVYTAAFMSSILGSSFAAYPLWVANYGVDCPRLPSGWSAWRLWQNGDAGRVAGVSGGVDVDLFDGTLDELRAFTAAGNVAWSCSASAWGGAQYWTCAGGNLRQCAGGVPTERSCARGCVSRPAGSDDVCIDDAPGWSCARSAWNGAQYWTCAGGSLYRCAGGAPEAIVCPKGCVVAALGSDDQCT